MQLFGVCLEDELGETIKEEIQRLSVGIAAREYIQYKVDEGGKRNVPALQSEGGLPPENPNVCIQMEVYTIQPVDIGRWEEWASSGRTVTWGMSPWTHTSVFS